MRFQPPRRALATLAAATLTLVGCTAPAAGPAQQAMTATPKVKLFTNSTGLGSLTMRVVDMRQGYGTQAIVDADPWDQLELRINSGRLKAPRVDNIARGAVPANNSVNSGILSNLPPASDYSLLVSLFATGSALVGQGASDSINVQAGTDATVSIYINSVGQISFDSPVYFAASSSAAPTFGFPMLVSNTQLILQSFFPPAPNGASPFKSFKAEWRDLGGALEFVTPTASIPVGGMATQSFQVPNLPAGPHEVVRDVTVIGLDAANNVISRKNRKVLVQRAATLSVDLQ